MENIVREYMDKFGKDRTHKRRYACLLGVLALLVCLAVFWRLKLVGTAMTNEAACGLQEHTHTDECYEDVLICGIATGETADGAEHEHTADCYQRQLICNIPEHTHTPDCYSDAEADTETEADWAASFPQEALTGDWAQDTVLVAASQAGYTESTRNWQLADDGTRRGYTRYGAWYGNPYGDWNGMFAAFCLHYAGVDDTYLTAENAAGVNAWAVSLFNAGEWQGPDHEAVPGDVVFFGSDDKIESCAVVTDVYDENGVPTLSVLAGDVDNTVAELTIPTDSDSILGYAATADAYAAYEADHPANDTEDEQTEETAGDEDKEPTTLESDIAVYAEPLNLAEGNRIKGVELTTKTTDTKFERSQQFDFTLNYTVSQDDVKQAGYKAYYDLPVGLEQVVGGGGSTSGDIINNGSSVGTYNIITMSDGHARVEFNYNKDFIDSHQTYDGTFSFMAKVGQTLSDNQTDVKISFPGTVTPIPIKFEDGKVTGEKSHEKLPNSGEVEFKVKLTVTGQSADVTLTDTLGENLIFGDNPGFTLTDTSGKTVDMGGPITVNTDKKSFTHTFSNLPIGEYTLKYRVKVENVDTLPNTSNTIDWTWKHENQQEYTGHYEDEVKFTQGKLEKDVSQFDKQTGQMIWYIAVKPSEFGTVGNVILTDTLTSGNHNYLPGWKIVENRYWIEGSTVAFGDGIPFDENGQFDFSKVSNVPWKKGTTYYLIYTTKATDDYTDKNAHTYVNTVKDDKGHDVTKQVDKGAEPVNPDPQPSEPPTPPEPAKPTIVKKYGTATSNTTAMWRIQVDPTQYLGEGGLTSLTLEDHLTNPDWVTDYFLKGDDGNIAFDFSYLDGSEWDKTAGTDYTCTITKENSNGPVAFKIEFVDNHVPQKAFQIVYSSKAKDLGGDKERWEDNVVEDSYTLNGKTYTDSDTATTKYTEKGCNIQKSGTISGNKIHWEVKVVFDGHDIYKLHEKGTYSIVDMLPDGLTYVNGSAKYTLVVEGVKNETDQEYPDNQITWSKGENNRQQMQFDFDINQFKDGQNYANGNLSIAFDTTIDSVRPTEDKNGYTCETTTDGDKTTTVDKYVNEADFRKGNTVYGKADATATVTRGQIEKTGTDVGGEYNRFCFEIAVNETGADLNADSDTLTLYDEMESFMSLDTGTGVKVTDANGNDVQFSLNYSVVNGKNRLTLTLPDSMSLKVVYYVNLYGTPGTQYKLSNEAWLEGYVSQKEQWSQDFTIRRSSATISAKGITIKKVDSSTLQALPNAEFAITAYDKANNTWGTETSLGTSDADGLILAPDLQPNTLYKLVETKAPDNYKRSTDPYYFVIQGSDTAATAQYVQDVTTALNGTLNGAAINTLPGGMMVVVGNAPVTGVRVYKKWIVNGTTVTDDDTAIADKSVTVMLQYQRAQNKDALTERGWQNANTTPGAAVLAEGDTAEKILNAGNNWTAMWQDLKKGENVDGTVLHYYYRVIETTAGYEPTYANNEGINDGTITVTNTIQSAYELPKTGGRGTLPYMAGGLALMAVSLLCAIYQKRKREGRQND